jgi:hypothetical protein
VPAVPAVPAGQAITGAVCRVQAKSAADAAAAALGAWTTWTPGPPGPRWARPMHYSAALGPLCPIIARWLAQPRATNSFILFLVPAVSAARHSPNYTRCLQLARPGLHCSIAPLLHCSIAPLLQHSLAPSSARRTHQTHSPIHSPTHPRTHAPIHPLVHSPTHSPTRPVFVSVSVFVSVPCLLLPLVLSASTPPYHAALLCSARLCSPPSSAITSLGACCSHSLPPTRTHRPSCEWAHRLVPRPSPLPATSLFCPVRCL